MVVVTVDVGMMVLGASLAYLGWSLRRGMADFGATGLGELRDGAVTAAATVARQMRYRTRVAGGLVQRPAPPEPEVHEDLQRFRAWAASQDLAPEEVEDLDGQYQAVLGLRAVSAATRREYEERLRLYGAPLPGVGSSKAPS